MVLAKARRANFGERRHGEVELRRITLPRSWVNRGWKKGQGPKCGQEFAGGPAPLLVRVLTAEARLLLPTLKKSPLAPKAAVATAFASADADYDDGAVALYGAPRYGRADERATRRIDSGCGNRRFFPSRAVPCGLLWPARLIRRNARAIHPPFIALCFDVPWSNTLG